MQYEVRAYKHPDWLPDTKHKTLSAAMKSFSKSVAAGADAASVITRDANGHYLTTVALFNARTLKGVQVI